MMNVKNSMWCGWGRSVVNAGSVLLMLTGCGSKVDVAPDQSTADPVSNVGSPSSNVPFDSYAGGGNVGNVGVSAPAQASGGNNGCSNPNWNASGFDYGGNFGSSPGVDCACDPCGDATCTATVGAACERMAYCRATLDGIRTLVDSICASSPAYAFYSQAEQTVISFGTHANDESQLLVFDNDTGLLVGVTSRAGDGRACYLGGKTNLSAGTQVTDPTPICRLCAASTQDPDIAAIPECPDGTIP